MNEEEELAAFEEAAFKQYFLSHVTRELTLKKPVMNKDKFLHRGRDGHYTVTGVEPAWWGWKERAKR